MSYTLDDLTKLVGEEECLAVVPKEEAAFIHDFQGHTQGVYKLRGDRYEEVPIDFSGMARKLAEGMSKQGFLEDFLRTIPVETLLKVKKRLDRPEAKVRDREGCYKLIVSGGPGRGLTLDLRE